MPLAATSNGKRLQEEPKIRYDTVIVGAGSAGAILATRLSEDRGRSVLLLEAGTDYPDLEQLPEEIKYGYGDQNIWARAFGYDSPFNWEYVARATDDLPAIMIPRGKLVGGSSAVNAQIFLRGIPEDFDGWAAAGNPGWSFKDVLPYFKAVESDSDFSGQFHGSDGPIAALRWPEEGWLADQRAFYAAARELGFPHNPDLNDPNSVGVGPLPMNNPDRVRQSTAIGYLPSARNRLNLTIRANCHVHRVLISGGRATGVLVESGGELFEVLAEEVILSAGSIGSPHILQLSGVGPAEALEAAGVDVVHGLPGVGGNLRDHPQVQLDWLARPDHKFESTMPTMQVALQYTATGSQLRNDMFIHAFSYVTDRSFYLSTSGNPIGVGMIAALYLAEGAGSLRIRSSDPHDKPLLDYNYLAEESDRARLRESVRLCARMGEWDSYADVIEGPLNPTGADLASDGALDKWISSNVRTSHHVSSTCKMGPSSDPGAVVDHSGSVHGIAGLRVADASIMPDCVRANTNLSTMMIGERIAALIRDGG